MDEQQKPIAEEEKWLALWVKVNAEWLNHWLGRQRKHFPDDNQSDVELILSWLDRNESNVLATLLNKHGIGKVVEECVLAVMAQRGISGNMAGELIRAVIDQIREDREKQWAEESPANLIKKTLQE